MCAERCFPFVALGNVDQMVCMLEVELGIYPSVAWSV